MSFFKSDRAQIAFRRMNNQYNGVKNYALNHALQASVIVGSAVMLALYFPGPALLALCLSALALICFNLVKPPNVREQMPSLSF